MEQIKAWMIQRNGVPMFVRLDEDRAIACANHEKRFYPDKKVEVVPVTISETEIVDVR